MIVIDIVQLQNDKKENTSIVLYFGYIRRRHVIFLLLERFTLPKKITLLQAKH